MQSCKADLGTVGFAAVMPFAAVFGLSSIQAVAAHGHSFER